MKNEFIAIDVETANSSRASICQIGIAKFRDGVVVDEWSSLINPEEDFAKPQMIIHGIKQKNVVDSPNLPEVMRTVSDFMKDSICISHSSFDREVFDAAFKKYGIKEIKSSWLNSVEVARETWGDMPNGKYTLDNVASTLGYTFNHHDALSVAKAAGHIMVNAMQETETTLSYWINGEGHRVNARSLAEAFTPTPKRKKASLVRKGNPEGPLVGEVISFTGDLTMSKYEAADIASNLGCRVTVSVTKKATMLVVGDVDPRMLKQGETKTMKERKAEELILKGQPIRIMNETDFQELIKKAGTDEYDEWKTSNRPSVVKEPQIKEKRIVEKDNSRGSNSGNSFPWATVFALVSIASVIFFAV